METFAKLFSSITDSTVWCEPNETRILWITMLAMADKTGYVGASVPGLASRAKISIEGTREGLAKFLAPDPYSRSDEYDGRRIEVADRGWVLLNYERFRNMRDEEERRTYERERKRKQRAGVRDRAGRSREVPQCLPVSAHAEAEAEAEKNKKLASLACSTGHDFDDFWLVYPRRVGKPKAKVAWGKLSDTDRTLVLADLAARVWGDPQWLKDKGQFIPHPTTYLNNAGWLDEWQPRHAGISANGSNTIESAKRFLAGAPE